MDDAGLEHVHASRQRGAAPADDVSRPKESPQKLAKKRPWTSKELKILRDGAAAGAKAIAEELGRSKTSVTSAAHYHRISLRTPDERRGTVLGQPRGISLKAELRDGALAGRVPADAIAAREALDAAALCPVCCVRDATHRSGYCVPCWHHVLAKRHREELERLRAEDDAKRALWKARQRVKRARDARAGDAQT